MADVRSVVDWLIDGARSAARSEDVLAELCARLLAWATKEAGGFSEEQIAAIEAVVAPLANVAEIRALRRTASNILDTYVGNQSGERILAGQIRRGHTESIHAAIWLSDMRGFTRLADRVPPEALILLLNRYFDCQVPAILDHGGEVLKFMGDGLLAIFPVQDRDATPAVCDAALGAAAEARGGIAALGGSIGIDGVDQLRFGLALDESGSAPRLASGAVA